MALSTELSAILYFSQVTFSEDQRRKRVEGYITKYYQDTDVARCHEAVVWSNLHNKPFHQQSEK